jgi:NADP-dependent aldehyde dehydrogenase
MDVLGKQFIGGTRTASATTPFAACDASTGEALPLAFYPATDAEIAVAAGVAADASRAYRLTGLAERAVFLETIASEIDALPDSFIQLVMRETGLPEARIRGERTRTTNQLRLFAAVVRRGDFLGVRIDTALPGRMPLPRPDIRQYRIGIGPVAVFGASNFPLAFSVAGGDTAAALAAGCPVVVKAHSSHPATAELVAQAIDRAVAQCGMPGGVFNLLFGDTVGAPLVLHPAIKAVAFTGSLRGGRTLFDLAASRPEPIPVFAEMASVNPVLVLPDALVQRSDAIAAGLANSVCLGAGQFCTNPGLVIGIAGAGFDAFCQQLATEIEGKPPAVMLNRSILATYREGVVRQMAMPGMELLAAGAAEGERAGACLFRADAALLVDPDRPLEQELFGPTTVVVAVPSWSELLALLPTLQGHLTASIFAGTEDEHLVAELLPLLEARVGRLIFNEYPTGVEVGDAMVHGGPYPATTDSRGTSVGSLAIERFLRPVCYQGYPDRLLPPELQDANPLGLRRLLNGEWL